MSRISLIITCIVALIVGLSFDVEQVYDDNGDMRLYKALATIGYRSVDHLPDLSIDGVSAIVGEDIVKYGVSKREGEQNSKRQSKHFVCTSCHNLEREDPDLSVSDPEARLAFTLEKGIPLLPATTLYGAVNRTSFYNGDYEKKYGDLVKPARDDIREAIQLCAVECAQGRKLRDWEVESVLAYLWTIDLKLNDLILTDSEKRTVSTAVSGKGMEIDAIQILESKYLKYSPAHFVEPMSRGLNKFNILGDAENGRKVYETSCFHCHYRNQYSYFNLDNSKLTFSFLERKADKYSRYSIYEVIRNGTFSKHGKASYMPRFPKEKMSDQQIEDLRAYISLMSE